VSAADLTRDVAAVAGAVGLVAMLAPAWGPRPGLRRGAGLVVFVGAWVAMVATLVPDGVVDRLRTPAGAGAALLGGAIAVLAAVLLVRLILGRPWVWFLLLALALPVRFPISLGGSDGNLLVPLYATIALGLVAFGWSALRGGVQAGRWPETPLDLPVAAFGGITLLSLLWTSDPTEGTVKAVFFWIPFVLLYLLVVAWWPHAPALKTLALTTMAMAVPVAVIAVAQWATEGVFWNERLQQANVYSRLYRVNSIFFDPNILGRYLVLAMLATVAVAWFARRGRTLWIAAGLLVVYGAGLVVTFSRSSSLMLMLGILIMALRAFGWRRTLATAGAVAVVGLAAAVVVSPRVRDAVTSAERIDKLAGGRVELIEGGLDLWRDDPVAGGGLGSFAEDFRANLSARDQRRTRVVISHNAPVTILSEVGAVGFALFLWLSVAALAVAWRASRAPDPDGWWATTMLAMLAGIVLHSLFYSALFEDPYTWVLAGGVVALAAAQPALAPSSRRAGAGAEPAPAR
jgi:hypothetical protein